ncbi:hypothetical protein ACJIZ3_005873 [Penstemon smallii]|uniref:GATA transcription factor n=1 Tax=Penstemon smallii TaxID=265156 RepID=A0ABD3S652_9LAMI
MGSDLMDEIDCGNFFDQIDDLIDFPSENENGYDGNLISSGDCNHFPSSWNGALPDSDPLFSAGISLPYEDIVQLEWLSTFVEESFSGGGTTLGNEKLSVTSEPTPHNRFQTSSPVSVLESSSSSRKTLPHRGPQQRARSKRPRPTTFNPRAALETPKPFLSLKSENFAEQQKKKRKVQVTVPVDSVETIENREVRKCMHCGITKTPQWRAGPMGPKTLCNACGVRHKSGRLFPEYRPAASPTFVPALHSNSHKKVLEMRSKVGPGSTENKTIAAKPDRVHSN